MIIETDQQIVYLGRISTILANLMCGNIIEMQCHGNCDTTLHLTLKTAQYNLDVFEYVQLCKDALPSIGMGKKSVSIQVPNNFTWQSLMKDSLLCCDVMYSVNDSVLDTSSIMMMLVHEELMYYFKILRQQLLMMYSSYEHLNQDSSFWAKSFKL